MRHSAGEAPLLVVPSLRGADGVDGTTVSFLLTENLKLQKKKEGGGGEEAGSEKWRSTRRTRKNSTVEFMLMCRSLLPNLAHGGSGQATSPCRRGERKRGRRKNFLGVLVLDKVVDVSVIVNDTFLISFCFYWTCCCQ